MDSIQAVKENVHSREIEMTKKEILGREYKLLKKTSYCLQESLDEVTFYP